MRRGFTGGCELNGDYQDGEDENEENGLRWNPSPQISRAKNAEHSLLERLIQAPFEQ